MDLPKEFDDRHWWIVVTIAGGVVMVASAPVKFVAGFIVGLGLLAFGLGQWIDHRVLTGREPGFIVTAYPWRPTIHGSLLSLIGIGLVIFGIYRLLTS